MTNGFLIDMDGVIYTSNSIIPGASKFISKLLEREIPFRFLTNNSQRSPKDVVARLKKMGIEVSEKHIFTSAIATAKFLAKQNPHGTAFVLGEGGLLTSLHKVGYSLVENYPDYVVVGEGHNFTLEMVDKAVNMILEGSKLIATNLDPSPKKQGWNNLGIASIIAMIEEATGKKAFSVGKPSPVMMRLARKNLNLETAHTIIIGDTMDTDIQGGVQMGYRTILVLTGVSKKEELSNYAFAPDLIFDSIADVPLNN